MEKRINYEGITAAPSDYLCSDGQLSVAVNLIHEDGSLKPVAPPSTLFQLNQGETVVFIHKTSDYEHFIISDTENLYWRTMDNDNKTLFFKLNNKTLLNVASIGNTLMLITSDGVYYQLWAVSDGNISKYKDLGNTIPDIQISFGLQGNFVTKILDEIEFDNLVAIPPDDAKRVELSDTLVDKLTNPVLAGVNEMLTEAMTEDREDSKFIFPFFVRYAYRMYDESLTHHSAPILMLPSTLAAPISFMAAHKLGYVDDTAYFASIIPYFSAYEASLDYMVKNFNNEIETIRAYSDIIKSIEVFVSAPIYTYNQQGKVTTMSRAERFGKDSQEYNSFFIGKLLNQHEGIDNESYRLWNMLDVFRTIYTKQNETDWTVDLPLFTENEIYEKIKSVSTFYHVATIPLNTALDNTSRTKIKIPASKMQTLVNLEQMTDDYDSHDILYPKLSFTYNSRLNLANVSKLLFQGFSPSIQMCYSDKYEIKEGEEDMPWNNIYTESTYFTAWVYIKSGSKIVTVKNQYPYVTTNTIPYFFFYPNKNAYKAVIKDNTTNKYTTITLLPHDFLNGAFWFGSFSKLDFTEGEDPEESADRSITMQNQIYTSEVNNPFYFPAANVNDIGTGTIIGVAAAVKALSPGQFGQFPLYVFASDGVWAMTVSDTGVYSTENPATRDVCNNPDSITSLDTSVVFTTERGIMMLSGSETMPLTDMLIGTPVDLSVIPSIKVLKDEFDIFQEIPDVFDFMDYIRTAKIAYDYKGQRLVVFNQYYTYCFMLSLRSKNWTMCTGSYLDTVNSYPDSYVMTTDNRLVNLSENESEIMSHSIMLTRPFKFDLPDIHKTITRLIQKGNFERDHIQQVLYGSNDLKNWFVVSSSRNAIIDGFRGTPYKYFRILSFPMLEKHESLSGFNTSFDTRQTNKLR